ncbi:hypothetical protein DASC09_037620 [Saccharomycopsis crataegensis]|uniref:Exocyst complex component Sec8 n=1 Tax=Saccharomycopsis crataegensis TaxID=43959 RepID=A0AAV5QPC6_9ASCO|nr:hypothetical protein DASC09_037620 [Saccharomycopsis crataegensis]
MTLSTLSENIPTQYQRNNCAKRLGGLPSAGGQGNEEFKRECEDRKNHQIIQRNQLSTATKQSPTNVIMELLNEWFTNIDDLNIDDKISQLQNQANHTPINNDDLNNILPNNDSSRIIDLIQQIKSTDSSYTLKDIRDSNNALLTESRLIDFVNDKIELVEYKDHLAECNTLVDEIINVEINENDQFNRSFFFESDINVLTQLLIKIVGLTQKIKNQDIDTTKQNQLIDLMVGKLNEKVLKVKGIFIKLLKKLIEDSDWTEAIVVNTSLLEDIINCCRNFNALQNLYLISNHLNQNSQDNGSNNLKQLLEIKQQPSEIWAIEIILQPIITKFIFHFYQKSLTNKLNQPELAIEYFLNYLDNDSFLVKMSEYFNNGFKTDNDKLSEITKSLDVELIDQQRSMPIEVTKVLNKFLKIKFINDVKANNHVYFSNSSNSRLFSNLLYQLNKYQSKIFELFYYEEQDSNLIIEILIHNNNWQNWIRLESNHLMKTFNDKFPASLGMGVTKHSAQKSDISKREVLPVNEESLMSEEIFSIDFNIVKANYLKPTKISVSFLNLIKNLIEFNIMNLRIPMILKVKLLKQLIFKILDMYHEKFSKLLRNSKVINNNSGANNYLNNLISESVKTFGNPVKENGKTVVKKNEEDGDILNEIRVLSKIYCSIKYVIIKLQSYDQHVEFIKMYDYLNQNLRTNEKNGNFQMLLKELELNDRELYEIISMTETTNDRSIFRCKVAKFDKMIDEILVTLNNFLKKSLKIYLNNFLNLSAYWQGIDTTGGGDNDDDDITDDADGWGFDDELKDELDIPVGASANAGENELSKLTFQNIETFEDFISYGFRLPGNEMLKLTITKELEKPLNILINQLRFLRRCFGPNYLNTLSDYKIVEFQLLDNVKYYFHSYIIKINKFSLQGIINLKFDFLMMLKKISKLDTESGQFAEAINYRDYENISQQFFLMNIVDCCNVLMVNQRNFSHFVSSTVANGNYREEFQSFRNAQDFTKLRKFLSVRSLGDDELYDLVSRIV